MAPGRSGEVSAEIETRGDAPADAEDEEIDTVGGAGSRAEIDELMSMYVLGLHDVDGDVPDIDRHIDNLLFAEYQGFLEPSSPVLESWLTLLGTMSDAKAAFDSGHCVRVATLAREIALILNVGDSEIREITLAGLVYGLGRLAVPSSLLESAMSLDDRQRRLVQECPRVTRSVLAPLAALGNVVTVASLYAERMDGSGYPEGRQGDSTPLGARILAVADTYEALIADRPYRPSHARSRALAIIQAQSGFLFDGLVTDSLEAVARGQI
jgi:HD-GYP domain-containing protein (c-di-GMP phosphodiesterase class II)